MNPLIAPEAAMSSNEVHNTDRPEFEAWAELDAPKARSRKAASRRRGRNRLESILQSPNAGELDVLSVLWQERLGANKSLRLSQIHDRVRAKREALHEPVPALTTISTHLRNLYRKQLIEQVRLTDEDEHRPVRVKTRGTLTPQTRSPLTAYRALYNPSDVLRYQMHGIIVAYPPELKYQALVDFARALKLPEDTVARIKSLLPAEGLK
jgi:predicted transcriptional regulator